MNCVVSIKLLVMVPSRAVTRPEVMVSTVGVRLGTGAAARLSRAKAELFNERQ